MPESQNENKKVDFSIFMWAIGLIATIIGVMSWTQMTLSSKVDKTIEDGFVLKQDVGVIKNDVNWIRKSLESIEINAKQQSTNSGGSSQTPKR